MSFASLLTTFAVAVAANNGEQLASLFTEDGTYQDGFFGTHTGRPAIAAMLQSFHETGRDYFWEFVDPVSDGAIGYARFRFSYASRLPEAAGRPVLFEGISCFHFRDGLIAYYREAFDRGVALVQLELPAERIKRVLERAAAEQNRRPKAPLKGAGFLYARLRRRSITPKPSRALPRRARLAGSGAAVVTTSLTLAKYVLPAASKPMAQVTPNGSAAPVPQVLLGVSGGEATSDTKSRTLPGAILSIFTPGSPGGSTHTLVGFVLDKVIPGNEIVQLSFRP